MYKLNGTTFKVDRRYKDLKAVGRGSYGVVASATDTYDTCVGEDSYLHQTTKAQKRGRAPRSLGSGVPRG